MWKDFRGFLTASQLHQFFTLLKELEAPWRGPDAAAFNTASEKVFGNGTDPQLRLLVVKGGECQCIRTMSHV